MGSGDLNMKKSWFPGLIKNRAKVWEDQEAARQERKRAEERRKEIEQERQRAEMQRLSELAGAPKKQQRVEFLYQGGGGTGQAAVEADREAYLLGKKRIDDVLGKDTIAQGAALGGGLASVSTVPQGPATGTGELNLRDLNNKVALDPLLAIKRQEAAQVEALVAKAKAQKEAALRHEARKSHRSGRSDSHDRHTSSRRDRSPRESESRRHRHASHSHRHRDEDERQGSSRRRSESRDRYHDRHRSSRRRSRSRDASRSPRPRHSSSRLYDDERDEGRDRRRRDDHEGRREHGSSRRHRSSSRDRSPATAAGRISERAIEASGKTQPTASAMEPVLDAVRAQRLAAMTAAAADLDQTRNARLARHQNEESANQAREHEARAREADVRGGSGFVRELQLGAGLARS